jgi:hypothetical protein
MAHMDERPRRRWLRFSLRTLFLLVTLVAVWLGWSLNWIRQRQYVVAHSSVETTSWETGEPVNAPGLLWLFGEPGYYDVRVLFGPDDPRDNTPAEVAFATGFKDLFPEAQVFGVAIRTHTPDPPGYIGPEPFPPIP